MHVVASLVPRPRVPNETMWLHTCTAVYILGKLGNAFNLAIPAVWQYPWHKVPSNLAEKLKICREVPWGFSKILCGVRGYIILLHMLLSSAAILISL